MKPVFFILVFFLGLGTFNAAAQPLTVVTDSGAYSRLDGAVPKGPWIDLVKIVMSEAGIETYGIEIHPWARAYNLALKNQKIMILPLARTRDRESLFKWSGPIMPVKFFLVGKKDTGRIRVNSMDSAKAYRIGVMREDVSHHFLESHLFTRLHFASGMDLLLRMLDGDRVDLICSTRGSMAFACMKNGVDCAPYVFEYELEDLSYDLYMAFHRETSDDLVGQVSNSLERVKLTSAYKDIMRRLGLISQ